MIITLTVNGKQVKATVDEKEMKEAMEEKKEKRTGHEESEKDGDFYFVDWYGGIGNRPDGYGIYEKSCYASANYYTDAKVAANNARADALMRKLRRFAAEHGGCVAPKEIRKGRRGYALRRGSIGEPVTMINQVVGIDTPEVLFANADVASEAAEIFKDELKWYFTEYDPMPEGWWES